MAESACRSRSMSVFAARHDVGRRIPQDCGLSGPRAPRAYVTAAAVQSWHLRAPADHLVDSASHCPRVRRCCRTTSPSWHARHAVLNTGGGVAVGPDARGCGVSPLGAFTTLTRAREMTFQA
jgi:hypothetical protein